MNLSLTASDLAGGENAMLARRPYIASNGRHAGKTVIVQNTGKKDDKGNPVYVEQPIQINAGATLRKDEWINLEEAIIEASRERLVIVDDLVAAGLTYNVGGLGTLISEWETASEMTDATITMDGETLGEKDRQEFGLTGVPIPIIQKPFSIGERTLLASRMRGAGLDVTQGTEAARSVARVMESMVFNGSSLAAVNSAGNRYGIPGLLTFADRATAVISDWNNPATTPATILSEILQMVKVLETQERKYGPFKLYIPGAWAWRFREDFKANSDKTLMERVLDEDAIDAVRVSDALAAPNVVMIQMDRGTIDLAMAADITTVQWQSGSGWTNHFQVFSAMAPRLKSDFDGHTGILHAKTP